MADTQYLSLQRFPGDGTTGPWEVNFAGNRPDAGSGTEPFLDVEDVVAFIVTPATSTAAEIQDPVALTHSGPNTFTTAIPVPSDKELLIQRSTEDRYPLVDFQQLQAVSSFDLDQANRQLLFLTQEAVDRSRLAEEAAAEVRDLAQEANATADNALEIAEQALANSAVAVDDSAAALAAAQSAVTTAGEAETKADAAVVTANEAKDIAEGLEDQIVQAVAASAEALATANAIDAKATEALATANDAADDADTALSVANAVDAKAQTALDNSATALATANSAEATAAAVDAKAQTALDNAAAAVATADGAQAAVTSLSAALAVLRTVTVPDNANTDSTTDIDTLGAVSSTAGIFPKLLGGPYTARNNGHPDGVEPTATGSDVTNYYWIITYRFNDGTNRFQIAVPYNSGAVNSAATIKFRIRAGTWGPWRREGDRAASIAQSLAQAFATAADTALRNELIARHDPLPITKYLKTTMNGFICLVGGVLWATSGNGASYTKGVAQARNYEDLFGMCNLKMVPVPTVNKIVDFGGCGQSYWALDTGGNLYTWGENAYGQLGLGHTTFTWVPTLSRTGVTKVYDHVTQGDSDSAPTATRLFLLGTDGGLYGCGYNGSGALGLGDTTSRSSWTRLTSYPLNTIKNVWNLGGSVGCLIVQQTNDALYFSGYDGYGQSGLGSVSSARSSIVDITAAWGGASNIAKLVNIVGGFGYYDTGADTSCTVVMQFTDSVRTCGANQYGQCGDGTTTVRYTPYTIPSLSTPAQVVFMGGGAGTCIVRTTAGALLTWGYNGRNQIMDGTTTSRTSPYTVPGVTAQDILSDPHRWNSGYVHTLFYKVLELGSYRVYGTGINTNGELGDGTNVSKTTPVRMLTPAYDVNGAVFNPVAVCAMNTSASGSGLNSYVIVTAQGFLWFTGYLGNAAYNMTGGSGCVTPQPIPIPWKVR